MSYVTPARLGQFKELQDTYNEDIYLKKIDIGDYFSLKRVDFATSDWVKDGDIYTLQTGKSLITDIYTLAEDGKFHNTATSIYKSTTCTLVSTTAFEGFYTYVDTVTLLVEKDGDGNDIQDKYATNTTVALKANKADVYTKSEIDAMFAALAHADIDTAMSDE